MERYVGLVVRHRVWVVVAVLIVTAALAAQARHVRLEIRRRALDPRQHPYVQIHNRITELFDGGTIASAGVIANQGDLYTPEVLGKIYSITQGRLRHRNARVTAKTDGRALRNEPASLVSFGAIVIVAVMGSSLFTLSVLHAPVQVLQPAAFGFKERTAGSAAYAAATGNSETPH